ncbi:unnamed protein product [Pleuronectes platessa]|uniref:Uncharacterized protein n=1 Tax=Pleuronectes platessa TaxID=8262 RepID=A0A9N7UTK1_PLEPL|nr:unnamed protein product [Pleuronectes platessa]
MGVSCITPELWGWRQPRSLVQTPRAASSPPGCDAADHRPRCLPGARRPGRVQARAVRLEDGPLAAAGSRSCSGSGRVRVRVLCVLSPGLQAGSSAGGGSCSSPGADGPAGSSGPRPPISVVGIPDPLTWIRCKVEMYLIHLLFELDLHSEEFHRGVKQALVHVSDMMSSGRYHQLRGIVSDEMVEHIEKSCRSLTEAQRQQLAVNEEDIIFLIPEDVSVVFDKYGRKLCIVVMRFWLLSAHEGPDDPEATHIFRVASSEDGSPQRKMATAVYEFQRELTRGASPDWTITTVWHWHWTLAKIIQLNSVRSFLT